MSVSNNLDPDWVAALSVIKHQAESLGIPFMVIGASARDILLDAASISPIRATRDVDLAIEIASWNSFEALKDALLKTEFFKPDKAVYRVIFQGHLPIDIIPYGAIETNAEIAWPPDFAILMSVAGMKDVFHSSLKLPLAESPNSLEVNVASSTGIVLLKLLAWESRKASTTKDAEDLYFLLRHYIDLGNQEHLQNSHADLFDDIDNAHARLLGRDLLKVCSVETLQAVKSILDRETGHSDESKLVSNMLPASSSADQKRRCKEWLVAIKIEMFT
jgi:predicted nucleotidyltransferase